MRRSVLLAVLAAVLALPGAAWSAAPAYPPGAYTTVQRSYDLGRETLLVRGNGALLHAFPARLAGEVTVPVGASGRRPVVVLLHGAHQSCEIPGGQAPTQDWPCRPGFLDVPSFQGYRYVARILASYGFVVVSLDGNPVAPADSSAFTFPDGTRFSPQTWMDLRAKIVDAQLRRLERAAGGEVGAAVDFGLPLAGRADLGRVGLVGHSRGGEGVVWASLLPGPHRYRVRAIVALAPVDFFRRLVPDVPFGVVLPYCDGDVYDLEGAWFFDDARTHVRTEPLLQVLAEGGNHNFFNRVWADETGVGTGAGEGGSGREGPPDLCAPGQIGKGRLDRFAQEAFGVAVIVPFMRAYVGPASETERATLVAPLGVDAKLPATIGGAAVRVSYLPASAARLDLIRPETNADLRRNLLGGALVATGLDKYILCLNDPGTIRSSGRQECGTRPPFQANALASLRVAWSRSGARLTTTLPPGRRDLTDYAALTLRVAVDPGDEKRNPYGASRPFSLALRDVAGRVASVAVREGNPAVRYPRRGLTVLSAVRVPLAAFAGVDVRAIAAIEIRFDGSGRGRLLLTDVSLFR